MEKRFAIVALLVWPLMGCGLFFHGSSQTVFVNSDPPGAEVRTGAKELQYWTPAAMQLSRRHSYELTFELPGYAPATLPLKRHIMPEIVLADLIGTAGLGLVADAIIGSWYRLKPGSSTVTLVAVAPVTAGAPQRVSIMVRTTTDGKVSAESSRPGVGVRVSVTD